LDTQAQSGCARIEPFRFQPPPDRSSHLFRQQLISEPIQQVDGWVEISSKPGLSVEVDRATLDRYRT
jgi:L-alanine-DL-glutamate epimerase-like enolase superfamily enzyme